MRQSDLSQLQRLGIDIWVSPERARELIAAGLANPLVNVDANRASQTISSRQMTPRTRIRRESVERTKPSTIQSTTIQNTRRDGKAITATRKDTVGSSTAKPFTVHLRVFLYGSVAMIVEYSTQYPEHLPRDVLRALSGFDEHQLNEFHFKYPLVGLLKNETTIASLAGAQEGFHAWFEQRVPHCESIIAIGTRVRDTSDRLSKKISHTVHIDEFPVSRDGKQKLWDQIKNLNV